MVAAIAASRNDCTAKMRMLVMSHRWPAMAICRTSTSAASSVINFSPNWGSGKLMSCSEQECRHQRQRPQHKGHRKQFRNAKEAHLGVGGFNHHNDAAEQQ